MRPSMRPWCCSLLRAGWQPGRSSWACVSRRQPSPSSATGTVTVRARPMLLRAWPSAACRPSGGGAMRAARLSARVGCMPRWLFRPSGACAVRGSSSWTSKRRSPSFSVPTGARLQRASYASCGRMRVRAHGCWRTRKCWRASARSCKPRWRWCRTSATSCATRSRRSVQAWQTGTSGCWRRKKRLRCWRLPRPQQQHLGWQRSRPRARKQSRRLCP
mmetsp:Transcript_6218/g.16492  ORF Transcript_6218/g.16492 Transcript_6218/m.16492 type:complete len:217 (+) Transcript_6218:1306-1956(+)